MYPNLVFVCLSSHLRQSACRLCQLYHCRTVCCIIYLMFHLTFVSYALCVVCHDVWRKNICERWICLCIIKNMFLDTSVSIWLFFLQSRYDKNIHCFLLLFVIMRIILSFIVNIIFIFLKIWNKILNCMVKSWKCCI